MAALGRMIGDFAEDEGGAAAIEYGLIAALVAVGVIAAMVVAGGGLGNLFGAVGTRATTVFDNADV